MTSYHIDVNRWAQLDILNQMGNIYAEVGRTIKAKNAGNEPEYRAALSRALDLFDATAETLQQQKSPRLREVLLAKYQFLSLFFAERRSEDPVSLENYFMHFAIAVRLKR